MSKIITTNKGDKYELIREKGRGSQAVVWVARNLSTNKYFACKTYLKDPSDVCSNIEKLVEMGGFEDVITGKELKEIVCPIDYFYLKGSSFGYIMELVDLDSYVTVGDVAKHYPSADIICKIIKNFSKIFYSLHSKHGMAYKDINENNIHINCKTGDIKIIDNDNIGYDKKYTIKGTSGYMAPEVICGAKPDTQSDKFSMAVYIYRLLVGGFPFYGKAVSNYCDDHDILSNDPEVQLKFFGQNPVFVFHPTDKSNSIEDSKEKSQMLQTLIFNSLPKEVKDLFINVFVTNLSADKRAERPGGDVWYETFEKLENELVTCPKCFKKTFVSSQTCINCLKPIPKFILNKKKKELGLDKVQNTNPININQNVKQNVKQNIKQNNQKNIQTNPISNNQKEEKFVEISIMSLEEPTKIKKYKNGDILNSDISKNLSKGQIAKILYRKDLKKFGIGNLTKIPWIILDPNGKKTQLAPGKIAVLAKRQKIVIKPKCVQLNIKDV